jgi:hypothetical protein
MSMKKTMFFASIFSNAIFFGTDKSLVFVPYVDGFCVDSKKYVQFKNIKICLRRRRRRPNFSWPCTHTKGYRNKLEKYMKEE